MRLARIMAGSSSVSQRKPMESLPCVTSISSVTSRGWEGAANRRGGSGSVWGPRVREEKAVSRASSTRWHSALPQ